MFSKKIHIRYALLTDNKNFTGFTLFLTYTYKKQPIEHKLKFKPVSTINETIVWMTDQPISQDESIYLKSMLSTGTIQNRLIGSYSETTGQSSIDHNYMNQIHLSQDLSSIIMNGSFQQESIQNQENTPPKNLLNSQIKAIINFINFVQKLKDQEKQEFKHFLNPTLLTLKAETNFFLNKEDFLTFVENLSSDKALSDIIYYTQILNLFHFFNIDDILKDKKSLSILSQSIIDHEPFFINEIKILLEEKQPILDNCSNIIVDLALAINQSSDIQNNNQPNTIVDFFLKTASNQNLKPKDKRSIQDFSYRLLERFYEKKVKINTITHQLLCSKNEEIQKVEFYFVQTIPEFFTLLDSFLKQNCQDLPKELIATSFSQLIFQPETRQYLLNPQNFDFLMNSILKVSENEPYLFARFFLNNRLFIKTIVQICTDEVRLSIPTVFRFLQVISGDCHRTHPLIEIFYSIQDLNKSKDLILETIAVTITQPDNVKWIEKTFKLFKKMNNFYLGKITIEEMIQVLKNGADQNQVLGLFFKYCDFKFDKLLKGKMNDQLDKFIFDDSIDHVILYLLTNDSRFEREFHKINSLEFAVNVIEKFATDIHFITAKSRLINYLRKESTMTKYYAIVPKDDFIRTVFEESDYHVIEEYCQFYQSSMKDRNRMQYLKSIFLEKVIKMQNLTITMKEYHLFTQAHSNERYHNHLLSFMTDHKMNSMVLPRNHVLQKKNHHHQINLLLLHNCINCSDFMQYTTHFQTLLDKESQLTLEQFLKDKTFELLWTKFSDLVMLLGNFRFVFNLHFEKNKDSKMDIEVETVESRLFCMLENFNQIKSKIHHFKQNFDKLNPLSIKSLFGSNNSQGIFESILPFFSIHRPEEVKMTKVIFFILEREQITQYLNLYEIFADQLIFPLVNKTTKSTLIQKINSLFDSDDLLSYSTAVDLIESNFESLSQMILSVRGLDRFKNFKLSLEFIGESKDQYEFLKEFTTEIEGFDINWQDIDDLELIDNFITAWKAKSEGYNSLSEILFEMEKIEKQAGFSEISKKIEHHLSIFQDLKNYKKEIKQTTDTKLKWIKKIVVNSLVKITFAHGSFNLIITDIVGTESHEKVISFEEFSNIRNVIKMKSFIQITEISVEETNNDKKFIINFLKIFKHLESIKSSHESLEVFGFLFKEPYSVDFEIINEDLTKLEKVDFIYQKNEIDFNKSLQEGYLKSFLGTFMFGKLFERFLKIFSKPKPQTTDFFYLKYLGIGVSLSFLEEFQAGYLLIPDLEKVKFMIDFFDHHLLKLSTFYKKTRYLSEMQLSVQMVYIVNINEENLFQKIITINLIAAKKLPSHYNVLFCNEEMSICEIISFIFRVFACRINEAFILVHPESLSYETQQEIIDLYFQLNSKVERKSAFFLLTDDKYCLLVQQLAENKHSKTFIPNESRYQSQFNNAMQEHYKDITFVKSKNVLDGKSHWIHEQYNTFSNKTCLKVLTISGGIDKRKILKILNEYFQIQNLVLHIEIGQMDNKKFQELDEFLFSLLIFKFAKNDTEIVISPSSIKIFIEFDSSSIQNTFNELKITQLGFNVIDVVENVQQICPTLYKGFDFIRSFLSTTPFDLNPTSVVKRTTFQTTEIDFWTQKMKNDFFMLETEFLRSQILMFEKIINFFACAIVIEGEVAKEQRKMFYEILISSACALSKTAIKKIKKKQDFATHHIFDESSDLRLDLFKPPSLDLKRENTISPWNRHDVVIAIIIKKELVLAYKDEKSVSPEIFKVLTHFNKILKYDHFSLMLELMKLNTNPMDRRICRICLKIYGKDSNYCPKCTSEIEVPKIVSQNDRVKRTNLNKERKIDLANKLLRKDDPDLIKEYITAIQQEYTVTYDNYVKMLSIFIRAKSGIPIVIMGETGCGKTSLIKFLTTRILDDIVEIFNIHAGLKEADIIDRLSKFYTTCSQNQTQDHWLVFDEFNTSSACGLIKSIMTTRFCAHQKFTDNAIFVATCNPYDLKPDITAMEEAVGLKKKLIRAHHSQYKLLYTVNPIPETLLFYTFDFGQLSESDEKLYIKTWLYKKIDESFREPVSNLISEIHKEIKRHFGKSAASLRDLKRFITIFDFFKNKYFKEKNELQKDDIKSIVLTLTLCYCVRISHPDEREALFSLISRQLKIQSNDCQRIFKEEQTFLLNQFNLEKGLVQNQALSENVFCMFVCVLNKVPLFICGKPGSSKSLSVQVLFSRMKGLKSPIPFFTKFEELILIPYQGSEYSTSKGVEKVFERAENSYKDGGKLTQNKIPVVVFDEIGLAEISKNNPLKVLHFKLEIENIKVGFVGISNWQLDSSKMNRVLGLSRRDPDEIELELTAHAIGTSILKSHHDVLSPKFKNLAKIFYSLRESFKSSENENLYGLRDFYYLIKTVALNFEEYLQNSTQSKDPNEFSTKLYQFVLQSIMRNFNYSEVCWRRIWEDFCKLNPADEQIWSNIKDFSLDFLIDASLSDVNSRFLLVITDQAEVHSKIYQILENSRIKGNTEKRKYKVLIGSKFPEDIESEEYCIRTINEVIMCMEQNMVIVIHQFDKIFTSLYDLFNQNYRKHGNQNFCRIVQGSLSKSSYPVNDHFKVIVFMTAKELENADIPLLNRFEKYFLSEGNCFLRENQQMKAKISSYLGEIFPEVENPIQNPEIKKYIGNFSHNSLYEWANRIEIKQKPENDQNLIKNNDIEKFEKLLSHISNLRIATKIFSNLKSRDKNVVLQNLLDQKTKTLINFIQEISLFQESTFNIVYTFTGQFTSVKTLCSDFDVKEIVLTTFNEERELRNAIHEFYMTKSSKILIIKVNSKTEMMHMYSLQHLINSLSSDFKDSIRHVIILINYRQNSIHECDNFFVCSNWKDYFIDNLKEPVNQLVSQIILEPEIMNSLTKYRNFYFLKFNTLVDGVFVEINFSQHDDTVLNRIQDFYSNFTKKYSLKIIDLFIDFVFKLCENDSNLNKNANIFDLLIGKSNLSSQCETFAENIELILYEIIHVKLSKVIQWIEQNMLINSLFEFEIENNQELINFWVEMFNNRCTFTEILKPRKQNIEIFHKLSFPFTKIEYSKFKAFLKIGTSDSQDDQFNENFVQMKFKNFQLCDFFSTQLKIDITTWNEDWLMRYTADLIYLYLSEQNEFSIISRDVYLILSFGFKNQTLSILKYFMCNQNFVSNYILLLNSFKNIYQNATSIVFQQNSENIPKNLSIPDFFKIYVENLLKRTLHKAEILNHSNLLYLEYFRIKRLLILIEESSRQTFNWIKEFFFCNELIRIIKTSNRFEELLKDVLFPLKSEFNEIFTNLNLSMELIKSVDSQKMIYSKSLTPTFSQLMSDFEVLFFDSYLHQNQSKVDQSIELYRQVFTRIEDSDTFYLHAGSIVNNFIDKSDFKSSLVNFWNNQEKTSQNTNLYLKWFSENISYFQQKIPYLIINNIIKQISRQSVFTNIIKLSPELIDKSISLFLNLKTTTNLGIKDIFIISVLRILLEMYSNELRKGKIDAIWMNLSNFLEQNKNTKTSTLCVYVIKCLTVTEKINSIKISDKTVESFLVNERFSISNAECIPFVLESFEKVHEILDLNNQNIIGKVDSILSYLEKAKSENLIFGMYLALINKCQLYQTWRRSYCVPFLAQIDKQSSKWVSCLGQLGVLFIKSIFQNFNDTGFFSFSTNEQNEKQIKINITILSHFALVLSHQFTNSFFSNLINKKSSPLNSNFDEHFKNIYLPGTILPGDDKIGFMMIPYKNKKQIIYQCSSQCDFFYAFENCQHANSQEGWVAKCLLCGRNLGASTYHGSLFEGQIQYTQAEGIKIIENHFKRFMEKYPKGYSDPVLSIIDQNDFDLNVEVKTTNYLNFLTNSILLVLSSMDDYKKEMSTFLQNERPEIFLAQKIKSNLQKFTGTFKNEETTVILNNILCSIAISDLNSYEDWSLKNYYKFEKQLQEDILSGFYDDYNKKVLQYKRFINEKTKNTDNKASISGIIEEIDQTEECFKKFEFLQHMRISNDFIFMYDFIEKFFEKSASMKLDFPLTEYIFENIADLRKITSIYLFKEFYDQFIELYQGKISRVEADNSTIDHYIKKSSKLLTAFNEFKQSWNSLIEKEPSIRYECSEIPLFPVKETDQLARILPSIIKDNKSADLFNALNLFIKPQNQMIEKLTAILMKNNEIKERPMFTWKHISKKTIFIYNEKEYQNFVNKECVISHCNYGDLGTCFFNFHKFEGFLVNKIFELNSFVYPLIPQFKYTLESQNLTSSLSTMKNSLLQTAFTSIEEQKYSDLLKPAHHPDNPNYLSEIWRFLESVVLPRAIYLQINDLNTTLKEFIGKTLSDDVFENNTCIKKFGNIEMNKLYSFTLLVEMCLFRFNFEEVEIPQTRLDTNDNSRDWIKISESFGLEIRSNDFYSKNSSYIIKAVSRLILRATFNTDKVDDMLMYYLTENPTIWDIDFDELVLDDLKISSDIKLFHSLHVLKKLKQEKNSHVKQNQQSGFANLVNVDQEDKLVHHSFKKGKK